MHGPDTHFHTHTIPSSPRKLLAASSEVVCPMSSALSPDQHRVFVPSPSLQQVNHSSPVQICGAQRAKPRAP